MIVNLKMMKRLVIVAFALVSGFLFAPLRVNAQGGHENFFWEAHDYGCPGSGYSPYPYVVKLSWFSRKWSLQPLVLVG